MTDTAHGPARTAGWLRIVITGVFALLYAYVVWNAVGNLVQAVQTYGSHLTALGWGLWLFAAAFPVVAFAVALGLCWRRRAGVMLLLLFTGLAVVGVFWLNVQSYSLTNLGSLVSLT